SICLFPVAAPPMNPAPAPISAPIPAPLPPPAIPPINAPPAAPPPVVAAVLLPFPFVVLVNTPVWIWYVWPRTEILVRAIESSPSPFILPLALALTTVPLMVAPVGSAGLPSTLIGWASVARNVWPAWFVLELNPWLVLTVRTVPLGTTIG